MNKAKYTTPGDKRKAKAPMFSITLLLVGVSLLGIVLFGYFNKDTSPPSVPQVEIDNG